MTNINMISTPMTAALTLPTYEWRSAAGTTGGFGSAATHGLASVVVPAAAVRRDAQARKQAVKSARPPRGRTP